MKHGASDRTSDQMHRVSIDSFQPETQRYALKRGVGYLNDIQGFPDPALYPDIAEADCRLVVRRSQRHCRSREVPPQGPLDPDPLQEGQRWRPRRISATPRPIAEAPTPTSAFEGSTVQRALRRNFTRSAMALTTSAPTRLEICEAQSPSRKPSRNFAVATPETEG